MNLENYEDHELKKIAPNLFGREKRNPFEVPRNYFDDLPSLIQEKITKKPKETLLETLFLSFFRPQLAFLLVILICFVAGGLFFYQYQQKTLNQSEILLSFDDLTKSGFIEEMDESFFVEELLALNEAEESLKPNQTGLEDYLIENGTELNLIIN